MLRQPFFIHTTFQEHIKHLASDKFCRIVSFYDRTRTTKTSLGRRVLTAGNRSKDWQRQPSDRRKWRVTKDRQRTTSDERRQATEGWAAEDNNRQRTTRTNSGQSGQWTSDRGVTARDRRPVRATSDESRRQKRQRAGQRRIRRRTTGANDGRTAGRRNRRFPFSKSRLSSRNIAIRKPRTCLHPLAHRYLRVPIIFTGFLGKP